MSEHTRAYLYRIALAVLGALAAYGVIGGDEVPVWAEIIGAVAGIGSAGLATLNTSPKRT